MIGQHPVKRDQFQAFGGADAQQQTIKRVAGVWRRFNRLEDMRNIDGQDNGSSALQNTRPFLDCRLHHQLSNSRLNGNFPKARRAHKNTAGFVEDDVAVPTRNLGNAIIGQIDDEVRVEQDIHNLGQRPQQKIFRQRRIEVFGNFRHKAPDAMLALVVAERLHV